MPRIKILLAGFRDDQIASLASSFPSVAFRSTENVDDIPAERASALIGITRAAFDRVFRKEIFERDSTIRWVHAPGAGIETYIYPELEKTPFVLTNGKIIQGPEVAEHAVALLLSLTRRLAYVARGLNTSALPRPIELRGKNAVIIGLGGVGLNLAEKLDAFGMKVYAVSEDNVPIVSFVEKLFLADELCVALSHGDVVCMTAPVTPASRRMIGEREFRAMRKGAYFVNVSRGATVDTDALTRSIEDGYLAGAGLDVTDPEPLPQDHPLRRFVNVVVTPHLAGFSDRLADRNGDLIEINVRRFLAGRPLINVVDKIRGF